jgi:molybdate transport system substrate-binding protein
MAPAEINILSAGAVAPGLKKICQQFECETGNSIKLTFATAPGIVERISAGLDIDLVIAPPAVLDELATAGKLSNKNRISIGRIGVGVMVREGAPHPSMATVEELKQSLLGAAAIVYNRASTGLYLEALFQRLGIDAELKGRSIRYADFGAVLEHVRRGGDGEIGFGATTVIIENPKKGVTFVGPLPAEIQNYTAYAAAIGRNRFAKKAAHEFLDYLGSARARALFAAAGID